MSSNPWSSLYTAEKKYDTPVLLSAKVVHGFKRGSKELGIPTANLCMEELGEKGDLDTGIYYGWSRLQGQVYPAVVSIGWNPFYHNTKKTIEAHLLHELSDFYDEKLDVLLLGYLRQESNFNSVDELVSCIHSDIEKAKSYLTEDTLPTKWAEDSL